MEVCETLVMVHGCDSVKHVSHDHQARRGVKEVEAFIRVFPQESLYHTL